MKIMHVMSKTKCEDKDIMFAQTCVSMAALGYDISVIVDVDYQYASRFLEQGIQVYTHPFGEESDIYAKRRMRKIINHVKPDIVHVWDAMAAVHVPPWSRHTKSSRYITIARFDQGQRIKHVRRADYFLTATGTMRTYLLDKGLPEYRATHINDFVHIRRSVRTIARGAYDTPKGAPLVLIDGYVTCDKALSILAQAVASIEKIYVWITGDREYDDVLLSMIRDLNLSHRMKFLRRENDFSALLQTSDVYLCTTTSQKNNACTGLVHAWAEKTPVVTMHDGGGCAVVCEGEDALVADMNDHDALCNVLGSVVNDKELQHQLAHAGYQTYLREFTKDKCIHSYLDFYRTVRTREGLSS